VNARTPLDIIRRLSEVGIALSAEKDNGRLMELILGSAKELTRADGGAIYTRTDDDRLRFEIMMTDSLGLRMGGTSGHPIDLPPVPLYDESGSPNESMVFEVFQSNGSTLGVAQTATNVSISARGLPKTTEFLLTAEDIDGIPLGSTTATTGDSPFDVSAQIPGDIHRLIIDATTNPVAPFTLSFTSSCLGFNPIP